MKQPARPREEQPSAVSHCHPLLPLLELQPLGSSWDRLQKREDRWERLSQGDEAEGAGPEREGRSTREGSPRRAAQGAQPQARLLAHEGSHGHGQCPRLAESGACFWAPLRSAAPRSQTVLLCPCLQSFWAGKGAPLGGGCCPLPFPEGLQGLQWEVPGWVAVSSPASLCPEP